MSKKLKIKFWKAEKALAMQILEQEGLPKVKDDGNVNIGQSPDLYSEMVELRGAWSHCDLNVVVKRFPENQDRDEYLDTITQAITDELFTGTGELKVGEMCEVRGCYSYWRKAKLIAILPEHIRERYVVDDDKDYGECIACAEAQPLAKRTEPKVDVNGEIVTYTWEEL